MRRNEAGMTIIELMIASLILAMIVIFIGSFLITGFRNNLRLEALADLGNYSQQTVNRLKLDLSQSKRLFDNSVMGLAYWQAVQLPKGMHLVQGSRLPEIIPHGSLSPTHEKDFRNPFVREAAGNMIFYAEHRPALEAKEERRIIDLFRFVSYFLAENTQEPFSPSVPRIMDLFRCQSGVYADLAQVRDLQNDESRKNVLRLLGQENVVALWDSQADAAVAFTLLEGYFPGAAPEVKHPIQLSDCRSAIGSMGRVMRTAGALTYSVAFNRSDAFPIGLRVPLYAQMSDSGGGFPHGFEVLVVGARGGRQILFRLVLAANLDKQILARESFVIATIKDS